MNDSVVLRFSDVSFDFGPHKKVLDGAGFSLRNGNKVALMGQNGAGKTTLFKLITGELRPKEGAIFKTPGDLSVAVGRQVVPPEALDLSVREYFATAFAEKRYNLDKLIKDACQVVNVDPPLERKMREFSGGQQARLLLAYALVQEPDILLLDEPTNNLDAEGLEHLTGFLMLYDKTAVVISHDADFLNAFTDGVLYLDVFTHRIEQYSGNYYNVVEEIKARIERENLQNARAQAEIKQKRAQAEVFAHKGGKLRAVAKRMREAVEEAEEQMVDVRREDRTIRPFAIPVQQFDPFFNGQVVDFSSVSAVKDGAVVSKPYEFIARKDTHVLVSGPNGVGKSTFLEKLAANQAEGARVAPGVRVGYYKQDFSSLDFEQKAFEALRGAMEQFDEQKLRSTAAGFLLDGKTLDLEIKRLSEGQKGLLQFCRLVLLEPGLLILDEPTNHINFRHLPVIAEALDGYGGTLVMVSHIPEFVKQVRIDHEINLGSL